MNQMYLSLFHGRADPEQQMEDWGEDGPTFGPYDNIQVTYGTDLKMTNDAQTDNMTLSGASGLIYYDGMYYGDLAIWLPVNEYDLGKVRLETFDRNKQ